VNRRGCPDPELAKDDTFDQYLQPAPVEKAVKGGRERVAAHARLAVPVRMIRSAPPGHHLPANRSERVERVRARLRRAMGGLAGGLGVRQAGRWPSRSRSHRCT
jgi:hypothetical protein